MSGPDEARARANAIARMNDNDATAAILALASLNRKRRVAPASLASRPDDGTAPTVALAPPVAPAMSVDDAAPILALVHAAGLPGFGSAAAGGVPPNATDDAAPIIAIVRAAGLPGFKFSGAEALR